MRIQSILSETLHFTLSAMLFALLLVGSIAFVIVFLWRRKKLDRQRRGFDVLPPQDDDAKGK